MRVLTPATLLAACLMSSLACAESPVPVKAAPLKSIAIQSERSAPATVVSLSDSRIGAELNARVQEIPVRVGDVVEPGAVLARLDCGDYELEADELEASLKGISARIAFARQQLQRARTLEKQRTISQELLDQREAELATLLADRESHRARLAMARRKLQKCIVRAPFQAAVLERLASTGEYVAPGSPLIRVLDIAHLEVSADLLAEDAKTLDGSTMITFRNGAQAYPVELRALIPVIDPLSRAREARLLFLESAALPGTAGRLVWQAGLALPADLLVRRGGKLGVLLAEKGQARFIPVPNAQEGRPAVVNLPPQSLVITEGRFGLSDGDAILVAE